MVVGRPTLEGNKEDGGEGWSLLLFLGSHPPQPAGGRARGTPFFARCDWRESTRRPTSPPPTTTRWNFGEHDGRAARPARGTSDTPGFETQSRRCIDAALVVAPRPPGPAGPGEEARGGQVCKFVGDRAQCQGGVGAPPRRFFTPWGAGRGCVVRVVQGRQARKAASNRRLGGGNLRVQRAGPPGDSPAGQAGGGKPRSIRDRVPAAAHAAFGAQPRATGLRTTRIGVTAWWPAEGQPAAQGRKKKKTGDRNQRLTLGIPRSAPADRKSSWASVPGAGRPTFHDAPDHSAFTGASSTTILGVAARRLRCGWRSYSRLWGAAGTALQEGRSSSSKRDPLRRGPPQISPCCRQSRRAQEARRQALVR